MEPLKFLAALVAAEAHCQADPRYVGKWDGSFVMVVNAHGTKPPLLGEARAEVIHASDVDDLVDDGLLRALPTSQSDVERRFSITALGRQRARQALGEGAPDAVDLKWEALRGRLVAFVAEYEVAGAPLRGLPLDEEGGKFHHLRHLIAAGYLEETEFGTDQQSCLRPTEKAFAVARSWPSAASVAEAVVREVLAELEANRGSAGKGLAAVLAEGGRDLFVEVVAAVLTKQAGYA